LLSQRNIEDAVRSVGIGPRTLYRWMKEPDFDAAYRAARRASFSQSNVHGGCNNSREDHGRHECTRRQSGARRGQCIGLCAKAIEIEDIEARVSELERLAEQNK
jgi:hypothetical protein